MAKLDDKEKNSNKRQAAKQKGKVKMKETGVEWLGKVPKEWEVRRLKYVAIISPSNVDKKSKESETEVLLCNYTDVYYNEEITANLVFMKATASNDQIEKFTLKCGDIIITKDSEDPNDIAVPAYVPCDLKGVICGYHLALLRVKDGALGIYLKRVMDSQYARSVFTTKANGLTRYGLGIYALGNFKLPLPPLPEQKAIADFLDKKTARIDQLIEKKERMIELLQEKRSALISHAVTKGLDPKAPLKGSGVEWLGKVPKGWEVRKVKHAFKCIGSGTTPRSDYYEYYNGNIPWVTTSELREAQINDTINKLSEKALQDYSTLRMYPVGTLLFAMYGATIGRLGILGIPAVVNQACVAFSEPIKLDPKFTCYWLWMRRPVLLVLSAGGGQSNLNQDEVKRIRIPAPLLSEQKAIADFLDKKTARIDQLIEKTKEAIDLLKESRSSLISHAVTGQIAIKAEEKKAS